MSLMDCGSFLVNFLDKARQKDNLEILLEDEGSFLHSRLRWRLDTYHTYKPQSHVSTLLDV
jgi:hypothetical protein